MRRGRQLEDPPLELPAPGDWPDLGHLYGIHPRDVRLIPEDGGLTWSEVLTFRKALDRHRDAAKKAKRNKASAARKRPAARRGRR